MTLVWPSCADEVSFEAVYEVVVSVTSLGGAVGWMGVPAREQVEQWLAQLLARVRSGNARLAVLADGAFGDLVAVSTGTRHRVVGLGYWERLDDEVVARNAELHKVMVRPDARGRGHARSLVRALVDDARTAGIETLILDVRGNNHAAMGLYEAVGFEVCGRLPDFIAVGDERFDRVLYRYDCGRPAHVRRRGGRPVGPGASTLRVRSAHPDRAASRPRL